MSRSRANFTDDERLSLYTCFKIINVGENRSMMPKIMLSPVEVKKHYAWKKLGKITAEDAMMAYVDLVQSKLNAKTAPALSLVLIPIK